MARRRRGKPINGWLIIDKPAGLSSAAVVGKVRRITEAAKVGHGGTLDPLATGILPIALGEATKTVSYVMDGTKIYRFTLRWGEERTTDDAEGDIVATSEIRPDRAAVEAALPQFRGVIEQIPPDYSAVKIDGQRAYDLARNDKPVELRARKVRIDAFELEDMPDADHAVFRVVAGKGTYIRSLARDLARTIGTRGHVAALRRLAVGRFTEADAISLDKLTALGHSAPQSAFLLPLETALDDIPALALTEAEARRLRQGQPLAAEPVLNRSPSATVGRDGVVCAVLGAKAVAIACVSGAEIRPVRVLNV